MVCTACAAQGCPCSCLLLFQATGMPGGFHFKWLEVFQSCQNDLSFISCLLESCCAIFAPNFKTNPPPPRQKPRAGAVRNCQLH